MRASTLALILGASVAFAPVLACAQRQPGSIKEYVSSDPDTPEADEFPALGLGVINGRGTLQGQRFEGAEIIYVVPGGTGEMAGLTGKRPRTEILIAAGILMTSMFCPPVILASIALGPKMAELDDLVIAVDGSRIHNVVEFGAALNRAKSDEIVYLTVIRNSKRKQVQIVLPEHAVKSLSPASIFAESVFAR
jgi:S1-C subfamily serine protease